MNAYTSAKLPSGTLVAPLTGYSIAGGGCGTGHGGIAIKPLAFGVDRAHAARRNNDRNAIGARFFIRFTAS
jgi:hypothetical protein